MSVAAVERASGLAQEVRGQREEARGREGTRVRSGVHQNPRPGYFSRLCSLGEHIRLCVHLSCCCAVALPTLCASRLHLVVFLHMQSFSGSAQLFPTACVRC